MYYITFTEDMEQHDHAQASDILRYGKIESRFRVNGLYLQKVIDWLL